MAKLRQVSFENAWVLDGRKLSALNWQDVSSDDDHAVRPKPRITVPTNAPFRSHLRDDPAKPSRRTPARAAIKTVEGHAAHKGDLFSFAEQHRGAVRELLCGPEVKGAARSSPRVQSDRPGMGRASSGVSRSGAINKNTRGSSSSSSSSSESSSDDEDEPPALIQQAREPVRPHRPPHPAAAPLLPSTTCRLLQNASVHCLCSGCASRAALRAAALGALMHVRSQGRRTETSAASTPAPGNSRSVSFKSLGEDTESSYAPEAKSGADSAPVTWRSLCQSRAMSVGPRCGARGQGRTNLPEPRVDPPSDNHSNGDGSRKGLGEAAGSFAVSEVQAVSKGKSADCRADSTSCSSGDQGQASPASDRLEQLLTGLGSGGERVLRQLLRRRLLRGSEGGGLPAEVEAQPESAAPAVGQRSADVHLAWREAAAPAGGRDAADVRQAARRRAQSAVRRAVDAEIMDGAAASRGSGGPGRSRSLAWLEAMVGGRRSPEEGAAARSRGRRISSFDGSSGESSASAASSSPPSASSLGQQPSFSSAAGLSVVSSHYTPGSGSAYAPSNASYRVLAGTASAPVKGHARGEKTDGGSGGGGRRLTALSDSSEDDFVLFVQDYSAGAMLGHGHGRNPAGGGSGGARGAGRGAAGAAAGTSGTPYAQGGKGGVVARGPMRGASPVRLAPAPASAASAASSSYCVGGRSGSSYHSSRSFSYSKSGSSGRRPSGSGQSSGTGPGKTGDDLTGSSKGWLLTEAFRRLPATGSGSGFPGSSEHLHGHDHQESDSDVSLDGWDGVRSPSQRLPLSAVWGVRHGSGGPKGASPASTAYSRASGA